MPEEGHTDQHKYKEPEMFANHLQLSCMDNLAAWDSLLLQLGERHKPRIHEIQGFEST